MELLEERAYIANDYMVLPFIPEEYLTSFMGYLNDNSLIFMDEPKRMEEKAEDIREDLYLKTSDLLEAGKSYPPMWV